MGQINSAFTFLWNIGTFFNAVILKNKNVSRKLKMFSVDVPLIILSYQVLFTSSIRSTDFQCTLDTEQWFNCRSVWWNSYLLSTIHDSYNSKWDLQIHTYRNIHKRSGRFCPLAPNITIVTSPLTRRRKIVVARIWCYCSYWLNSDVIIITYSAWT